jgi:ribonuclease III
VCAFIRLRPEVLRGGGMGDLPGLEERIGYRFRSPSLLEEALRHGSLQGEWERSYQRLEFLGDAVLNLCIAEEMFLRFTGAGEGRLSRARSAVISNFNLEKVGERIGIPEVLRTDPSVRAQGGGVTRKMVADAVEAVIGAIFVDGGYESARDFVLSHFREGGAMEDASAVFDPKSRLQEWCQANRLPLPRYRLQGATGPPHSRTFTVAVRIGEGPEETGSGRTKKEAEMESAARMLRAVSPDEDAV